MLRKKWVRNRKWKESEEKCKKKREGWVNDRRNKGEEEVMGKKEKDDKVNEIDEKDEG